jgi:hypothetical protein
MSVPEYELCALKRPNRCIVALAAHRRGQL